MPVESTNAEEDIGSGGNVPVIVIRTSSGSGGSPFGAFPSLFNTFFGNGNTRSGLIFVHSFRSAYFSDFFLNEHEQTQKMYTIVLEN